MRNSNEKTVNQKIFAVALSAAILTSAFNCLTVSAAEEKPLILGDANLDGSVSIANATEIQKYLADTTDFGIRQEVVSNVDSIEININSVTLIQKYLSGYMIRNYQSDSLLTRARTE